MQRASNDGPGLKPAGRVGAAAVLVDPLDVGSIARGIARTLAEAARLRQAGPQQAASFSWEASADALLACYRELCS